MLAVACGLCAGMLFDRTALATYGEWLFLASIVLLGLPHGAVDHIVMAKLGDAPLLSRRTASLIGLYLLLVATTLAAWFVSPLVVFAGFILLTWFHWGQGDAWWFGAPIRSPRWWREVVVRGALPMVVPMFGSASEYAAVTAQFVAAAGGTVGDLTPLIVDVRGPLALAVAPFAVWSIVDYARKNRWQPTVELLLLTAFFLVLPPLVATALYFCLWHSARHLVRLGAWTGARTPRVLALAAPLTVVSIVMLGALLAFVATEDVFSVYLALIAALTVPHVVVVVAMDLHERHAP